MIARAMHNSAFLISMWQGKQTPISGFGILAFLRSELLDYRTTFVRQERIKKEVLFVRQKRLPGKDGRFESQTLARHILALVPAIITWYCTNYPFLILCTLYHIPHSYKTVPVQN